MKKIIQMTVTMEVTIPQALALKAMFEHWTFLGGIGSSRYVAFSCDGDGDFQPKCQFVFTPNIVPRLTDEMKERAVVKDEGGNRWYDFDPVGWLLREQEEKRKEASRTCGDQTETAP